MNQESNIRYSRQLHIPGFTADNQQRLSESSVLLVGAGALGSIAGLYLAGAGVGKIGIADFDTVDISNLQRQPAFTEEDLGKQKCEVLRQRLLSINSSITVFAYKKLVTRSSASDIFAEFDFIIDASDNPHTKCMTAEVCKTLHLPYCIGAVREYTGQISTHLPETKDYFDIFPQPADPTGLTPCAIAGVFGPAPGIIGVMQAAEAIKYLSGIGDLLTDKLLLIDLLSMSFKEIYL